MKKINLILSILLFTGFQCMSQGVTPNSNSDSQAAVKADSEKYNVAFCDYKTDTLTYDQLNECNEINITNDPQTRVTFYSLVCRIGEDDIYEFAGRGNSLPAQVKEKLTSNGVTSFWLEGIIGKNGDKKLDIGTRQFFLKK